MNNFGPRLLQVPRPPDNGGGNPGSVAPGGISGVIRGVKFIENQTPVPTNRVSYTFNYFYNVSRDINIRFGNNVSGVNLYRSILGIEKTLFSPKFSLGTRLPYDTITGDNAFQKDTGIGKTSSSLGDLNVYAKLLIFQDSSGRHLVSSGLSTVFPTGPTNFANSKWLNSLHYIQLQPFIGYLYNSQSFYTILFASINFPGNKKDSTIAFLDSSLGYFFYKPENPSILRAMSVFLELHCNLPLNHDEPFNPVDLAGTSTIVNISYGVNCFVLDRSSIILGLVSPVTGPRPFALETGVYFNFFY